MLTKPTSSQALWTPNATRAAHCHIQRFINELVADKPALNISDYQQLHQWTLDNPEHFWQRVWDFCGVVGSKQGQTTQLGEAVWSDVVPARDTVWFPEAKLNYAENLLDYGSKNPEKVAILFQNEQGHVEQYTWKLLLEHVSIMQQWLQSINVAEGDVVAGYLPHSPYAVIAMLAATSLGAIWTSTSPDFGAESVIERFEQVKPKVLFCVDGYQFGGKSFSMTDKNSAISNAIESVSHVCTVGYQHLGQSDPSIATCSQINTDNAINIEWESVIGDFQSEPVHFHRVPFNSPLFILYSSGTTGKPKCIVHSVGGITLNHLKEHQLHCDVRADDRVFYYTTCGWMMWNWHVSALASGASLVIYDGNPVYPTENVLWELASRTSVTLFGTAAKYLEAIEKNGFIPSEKFALTHLRTLCSTGSVLYPEQFDYVYQAIKSDLHLASISGGTDICGCFVLGNPISPVYRGECQAAGLGLDVQVFNTNGESVIEQRGELVCLNSFPNQPIGFWNDDGERYHNAYWADFARCWSHGDDVLMTSHGGMRFFGRSDAILNPGGVRIGTAEIYQQVNQLDGIIDSIAVGRTHLSDEKIVLFVQLSPSTVLDDNLQHAIKQQLKTQCSPRHVPSEIYAISEIPKTKSGKLVELAVKQVLHGQEIKNKGAIANPHVLDEVAQFAHTV
ncbi:acetoacetate--CoA ligase [Vibrio wakamikoensis]|uniref:acetoacetate--CoA ligase n=1 Tax=Vibrio TaxID=662 RepID=UPI003AB4460A